MNTTNIVTKSETPEDYDAIFRIHHEAFGQENEAKLINDLRKTPNFDPQLSLVAFIGNSAVGHILFYPLNINSNNGLINTLGLVPFAVLPQFQNQGVGTQLVNEGLEIAKQLGHKSVIVAGDPNYYGRFGFKLVKDITNNIGEPPDHFMFTELESQSLKNVQGSLEYPPEFNDL